MSRLLCKYCDEDLGEDPSFPGECPSCGGTLDEIDAVPEEASLRVDIKVEKHERCGRMLRVGEHPYTGLRWECDCGAPKASDGAIRPQGKSDAQTCVAEHTVIETVCVTVSEPRRLGSDRRSTLHSPETWEQQEAVSQDGRRFVRQRRAGQHRQQRSILAGSHDTIRDGIDREITIGRDPWSPWQEVVGASVLGGP